MVNRSILGELVIISILIISDAKAKKNLLRALYYIEKVIVS